MDRLATQPRPARARKSLWTRDDGSIIDRTAPSGRWAPREEVPRLWAESRDRLKDGCCTFKPKLGPDGVPPLFAEAERRRAKRAKRKADCGCQNRVPLQPGADRTVRPRVVSGDWLVATLSLPHEEVELLKGRSVSLDEDAWHAVQAVAHAAMAAEVTINHTNRRRAKLWGPRTRDCKTVGTAPLRSAIGPMSTRCGWETVIRQSARFVHASLGSDGDSGTFVWTPGTWAPGTGGAPLHGTLKPWRTLSKVAEWLNTDVYDGSPTPSSVGLRGVGVYLRRGETWDGTEDGGSGSWSTTTLTADDFGDQVVLPIVSAKGGGPDDGRRWGRVVLGAYGESLAGPPVIDGSEGGPPQYGDDRIGVQLRDCCLLSMQDIKVRGFAVGVDVRGASRDLLFSGLTIQENATTGLRIGVRDSDIHAYGEDEELDDDVAAATMAEERLYPEGIVVDSTAFSSNGYDTEGADVALNFMATNCTISNNTMVGDNVRGIDGVVAQDASSGHLIEGNTIALHNKYCYEDSTDQAVLSLSGACGGSYVLYQPCDSTTPSCDTSAGLGYAVQYFSPGGSTAYAGQEAFAEDGIDLKNVQPRTPTSADTTVIRGNTIYGQTVHAKTGITINDGTNGVHIYNNRIFLNSVGILVTNSGNKSDWHIAGATTNVYIYRNLVYMNLEEGIAIKSAEDSGVVYSVDGVYIINNTIAHNMETGVLIVNSTDTSPTDAGPDVNNIYLYNNLIARNGIGGYYSNSDSTARAMQVAWSGYTALSGWTVTFRLDYNCYLGWERETDEDGDGVIEAERVVGMGPSGAFVPLNLVAAQLTWSVEGSGVQAATIDELYLQDGAILATAETSSTGTTGDSFEAFLEGLSPTALGGIDALDYTPTDTASLCVDAAWPTTRFLYDGTADDIAVSPDFAGNPNTGEAPDIGALELT